MRAGLEEPSQPHDLSFLADRGSVVYQISESIGKLHFFLVCCELLIEGQEER